MADSVMPVGDPVAMGAVRDRDLDAVVAQLGGANPHPIDMDLPAALLDDGGGPR